MQDHHFNEVLYSDSFEAFNLIVRDCEPEHPLHLEICQVREILCEDWDHEILYSPRKFLKCADILGKSAQTAANYS